jgi:hypothetical protein
MNNARSILIFAVVGVLGACGKGGDRSQGKAALAANGAPASCASYHAGQNGVVRTFCDGPAVVKFTINGASHTLKGGTCESAPVFNLNVGVVAGADSPKPQPDYFGLAKLSSGALGDSDVVTARVGGQSYMFQHKSGQAGPKGGHIVAEGIAIGQGGAPAKLEADFTC